MTGRVWKGTAFGGARGRTDVPKIVDWYMQGKIEIDPMISHVMPRAEINKAFELMKRGESIRGVVTSRPPDSRENQNSSGQGSTIFQSSSPFLIFFISVVSPPLRRIQSFTVCG